MTETTAQVFIAFIATIPATVTAICTLVVAMLSMRKLTAVQVATDGMSSHLVAATAAAERSQGVLQGSEQERARQDQKIAHTAEALREHALKCNPEEAHKAAKVIVEAAKLAAEELVARAEEAAAKLTGKYEKPTVTIDPAADVNVVKK